MKKSGNRPRECPGTPQQARASPICPAGRILFSNENGKLCAAALEMNFVPHHHLAPSMWHPPPESGDAHGESRRHTAFSDHVSLKILQDDGQSEEVCGQPRAKAQARQDAPPLRVPSGRRGQRPFPRAFRRVGQGDQGGVYRFRTFRQGD